MSQLLAVTYYTIQDGHGGFSPRVDQDRGCDVLYHPKGLILPDSNPPGLSTVPLDCPAKQSLPVQGTVLQP